MQPSHIASIALLSSAIFLTSCAGGAATQKTAQTSKVTTSESTMAPSVKDSTPKAPTANSSTADTAGTASTSSQNGAYVPYSETSFPEVVGEKKIALFFHATWCPTCRIMERDINANLTNIPSDSVIIKADYDKETELKRQYGITTQSTVVIIDKTGTAIKTLSAPDFSTIESELIALQN